jgi:hypothetical protein
VTLHAQLLAELDRHDPHRLLTLGKAVRAVVELHAPVEDSYLASRWLDCRGCDSRGEHADWPCRTVLAIARELGIEAGEGRG